MDTAHRIIFRNSHRVGDMPAGSVDLVVTSPPYPMIRMWDEQFSAMNPAIGDELASGNPMGAYDLMHRELEKTWAGLNTVMRDGGYVCINIGDAVRTVDGTFGLYPSHSRITDFFISMGFTPLPGIIWRKPSNSPSKFMGSGMQPAGAYVTLEHEHILIFRKGRRSFSPSERTTRRASSYFWEERNRWFSDVWQDLHGSRQEIRGKASRARSGAFPIELPLRLVNMFSIRGDHVVDPFLGTGTTSLAAAISGRNSTGYEVDRTMEGMIRDRILGARELSATYIKERVENHRAFVEEYKARGGEFMYRNDFLGTPVKERSEQFMELETVERVSQASNDLFRVGYSRWKP